jgi:ornithine cyclodeaminase
VPNTPLVLSEAEVRQLVDPQEALGVVRSSIAAFAGGTVNQPAPWHMDIPSNEGEIHIKGAYVDGNQHLAVKLATGFYRNPKVGRPSAGGMSVVLDAQTGAIEAILADNGYLTDLRTGLAGAIALDALANENIEVVGVVGSGVQARHQLQSLLLVRRPATVLITARDADRAAALQAEVAEWSDWRVEVSRSIEVVARRADALITTTPSRSPLFEGEWLRPGTHITAIGADGIGKRELDGTTLDRADVLVADDPEQCLIRGELQYQANDKRVLPLGDIIGGRASGRRSVSDVTVADLIGLGAEDAALATLVAAKVLSSE